jgi:sialate O-acetylesterase
MRFTAVLVFVFHIALGFAQVTPASVFNDHMVLQRDIPIPVWGTAKAHEKIKLELNGQKLHTKADKAGRWSVAFAPMKTGGPYILKVSGKNTIAYNDIYIGEVWLCSGQSNMDMTVAREDRYWCGVYNEKEEVANANYPLIRVYDVDYNPKDEPQIDVAGKWEVVSPQTIGHLSATAYFFARDIFEKYKVPIGLITTAYGASTAEAWISRPALQKHPQLSFLLEDYKKKCAAYDTSSTAKRKYTEAYATWKIAADRAAAEGKDKPREPKNPDPHKDQHNPAVLYNGMIAPLIPYAIRGAIWYQGESNGPTARLYETLMQTLIATWRSDWKQGDFPFLYVQLANHQALINDPVKDDPMVWVREAQLKNLSIPNTGMAVAIDNANPDDPNDIHPKNKQMIGHRLARIALAKVYGEKDLVYSGPQYTKMSVEENSIRLYFDHAVTLKAKGDILTGFAIAGSDHKFVWATAKIEDNTIVVSSPEVKEPVSVRYGWSKNPPASIYNETDLPASPFRTDTD